MKNMTRTTKKTQTSDAEDKANAELQSALNQPGIKVAMEIVELAERHAATANKYDAYLGWQAVPVITNSCNTVG
jgi:hypothetical protein